MIVENNEFELIQQAKKNDVSAFSELVRLYEVKIRACLAVRMNNSDEVDDIAQETFIIAYKKLPEFDAEKPFGPWLRGIAFNLLKNHWRKYKAIPFGSAAELEVLIEEEINLRYDADNESASLQALQICLTKLDETAATLIDQHYSQGLTVSELKEYYGIKHSTMTMRLHRLRDSLGKCIKKHLKDFAARERVLANG